MSGPLDGRRIVDFTVAYAGAFATMHLGDLGAEIVKVESLQHHAVPTRGPLVVAQDGWAQRRELYGRDYPDFEPGPDPWNRISWFNCHGRNKLSMTVDLTREEGREIFLRLVERSDGLVENHPAGTLEKLGLGPDRLLERNAALVVVRMAPLGQWGAYHRSTGFGSHFEMLAGIHSMAGYPEGDVVSSLHMDAAGGPAGASAFLLGLRRRLRTGKGGVVEIAQLEHQLQQFGPVIMDAALNHRVPSRWGNRDPRYAPQGVYRCAGDDEWVALSVRDDDDWQRLVEATASPTLADPRWTTAGARRTDHDEIDLAIAGWTAQRTKEEVFACLQAAGVPAGPVMTEADAFSDPQLHDRGFFQLLEHRSAGTHFHPGLNFRLSATPPSIRRAAPTLGQDNEYVYKEILGLGEGEYAALEAAGHIGDRPVGARTETREEG